MDAHTLNAWTRFALQKGGIGSCTALIDNPATEPEDLMFMAGEKIIVLRRLDDETPEPSTSSKRRSDAVPDSEAWFLGYCEGVVGRFKGAHVQFHGRLKKPVLMRRSVAGSIRDSSMRPMSKSDAAKMHLSQVPAGIPFAAINSDGEEDALSPVARSKALPLPTATSSSSSNPAATMLRQNRLEIATPPHSDEGHLRNQARLRRPAYGDDDDSDDSASELPWARRSSIRRDALPTRKASLAGPPSAPRRTSSTFTSNFNQARDVHNVPTIHQLPPSPISSGESPLQANSNVALPSIVTTTYSSGQTSRSDDGSAPINTSATSPIIGARTSSTSSGYTSSTQDDSEDEQGADTRRRDYAFSIYDIYGRDSVAFPNFDFREYGSKTSNLSRFGDSKSSESLNVPTQRSSSATDHGLQLPSSPVQRPTLSAPQQAGPMSGGDRPRRPGQLGIPAISDPSIPLALRSPSGRRPSAAPDPRMNPAAGSRIPMNMASGLRRQVETPPVNGPGVSPLDAAGAAMGDGVSAAGSAAAGSGARGPGVFDPRRRPSQTNIDTPARMQPTSLPPIYTGEAFNAPKFGSSSAPGSSSPPSADTVLSNAQDAGFAYRPGFAESRERRRSTTLGSFDKVANLELNEVGVRDAHAPPMSTIPPATAPVQLDGQPSAPHSASRPSFRTAESSGRLRNGQATSPGLGPVRASSDRLSERDRAHSGHGSGLLRKNPSNPLPGLHGGSGPVGLSALRGFSPSSQLNTPNTSSFTLDSSRPGSTHSSNAYSTGARSPGARSPLALPMRSTASPQMRGSPGLDANLGLPLSPGSANGHMGMDLNFDAMGFVISANMPPCAPLMDDAELKEKWLAVLNENDVTAAKKSRKVKKLVRTGVPASIRREVWLFLANASVRRRPGLFEQLCKTSLGAKGKRGKESAYETIEKDLHRTLPDHRLFMGDKATGRADLEGILKSYVHFNPMLGYTQGMGLLAAFALIHMPAEDAFWLLAAMMRNPQMEEYYSVGMKQLHVDSVVFSTLLKSMDPELQARFDEVGLESIMFTPNWFLALFTRVLPWGTLLRVWDVFFFEGPTWMLRVALAVVRILRERLMDRNVCPGLGEMLEVLLHPEQTHLTVENVLNCAFSVKLKDGEMRKLSRSASTKVREQGIEKRSRVLGKNAG